MRDQPKCKEIMSLNSRKCCIDAIKANLRVLYGVEAGQFRGSSL